MELIKEDWAIKWMLQLLQSSLIHNKLTNQPASSFSYQRIAQFYSDTLVKFFTCHTESPIGIVQ